MKHLQPDTNNKVPDRQFASIGDVVIFFKEASRTAKLQR
ncbi:Uncharacterised protein [Porphyromonas cangingivalis]|nr:Uncharacterised protein [Porphyromonas cangingivalis]